MPLFSCFNTANDLRRAQPFSAGRLFCGYFFLRLQASGRHIFFTAFISHAPGYAVAKRAETDPWKGCRGFALDFLTPEADKKKGVFFAFPTVSAFPRRSDVGFFFPDFFAETLDFLR